MNGYRAFCFALHGTRIPDVPTGVLERPTPNLVFSLGVRGDRDEAFC